MQSQVPSIEVDAVGPDVVMLDVREDDEWAAGHVSGSVHVPMSQVPAQLQHDLGPITPEAEIVVACKVGGRSAQVTAWLCQQGYNAVNLTGGLMAWHAAGRALESDGPEPACVL